jgi:hypothetical protein
MVRFEKCGSGRKEESIWVDGMDAGSPKTRGGSRVRLLVAAPNPTAREPTFLHACQLCKRQVCVFHAIFPLREE